MNQNDPKSNKPKQLDNFPRNIRYLRIKQGLSQEELAQKAGIDKRDIAMAEQGNKDLIPLFRELALALGVNIDRLIMPWYADNEFDPVSLEGMPGLTADEKLYVSETVRYYFGRLFVTDSFLNHSLLPEIPSFPCLLLSQNDEDNAGYLWNMLQTTWNGGGLIETIENQGIFVCLIPSCPEKFLGTHGTVNGYPYIAVNGDIDFRGILGAELVCIVFGGPQVTPPSIRKHAEKIGEIFAGKGGNPGVMEEDVVGRGHIDLDHPNMLERLVIQALREEQIYLMKAKELLECSLDDILKIRERYPDEIPEIY